MEPTIPTWGYRKNGDEVEGQIFNLFEGDDLPEGWSDNPQEPGPEVEPGPTEATMKHRGRGKFDVTDANGILVADNVTKEEATAKLAELNGE